MKKMNKKGFTLAELLIVIAIIAVLIAIAIPTFSGALRNARLQTDHANIRSAYAMVMTANMMGGIDVGSANTWTVPTADANYYFQKDGTLAVADANTKKTAYLTQADATSADECASSVGCVKYATGKKHASKKVIKITYTHSSKTWALTFE